MPLNIELIRKLRRARGWTQDEAAHRAGWSTRARWNQIETGERRNPELLTIEAVSKALGIPTRKLLK